jgi:DNA mismatch endonuclease (patch repair protein)
MDIISKEKRSWNMSRIKSKNTKPEILVRSLLHRAGYRFRLHVKDLPGTPDIVLPRHELAIFVHGCFWHRHSNCKFAYQPKSRTDFWAAKFRNNVERHRKVVMQLQELGWKVILVWECETSDSNKILTRIADALSSRTG